MTSKRKRPCAVIAMLGLDWGRGGVIGLEDVPPSSGEVPIPRQGLVEQHGHDHVGVGACQRAHGA